MPPECSPNVCDHGGRNAERRQGGSGTNRHKVNQSYVPLPAQYADGGENPSRPKDGDSYIYIHSALTPRVSSLRLA